MVNKKSSSALRPFAITLTFFFTCGSAPDAFCQVPPDNNSTLGKFEKSVQPPPAKPANPQPPPPPSRDQNGKDNNDHSFLGDLLSDIVTDMLKPEPSQQADPNMASYAQVEDPTMKRLNPRTDISLRRDNGDILIPFVRYDFAHQNISSTINANFNRLEAGYGTYALLLEHYVFQESAPSATLAIDRTIFLFRMSPNRTTEVDLGLGQIDIAGAQYTTFGAISLPIRMVLDENENLTLELRPTWSRTIDDYEVALHYGAPFWSVKIGYRTLNSPSVSLHGPFAGFALYY